MFRTTQLRSCRVELQSLHLCGGQPGPFRPFSDERGQKPSACYTRVKSGRRCPAPPDRRPRPAGCAVSVTDLAALAERAAHYAARACGETTRRTGFRAWYEGIG